MLIKNTSQALPAYKGWSLIFIFFYLLPLSVFSQASLHGTVTDESGKPVAGASVTIKGKTIGASTNENGEFGIAAGIGDTLSVSHVRFEPQDKIVENSATITIVLKAGNKGTLSDVVVVGYGTQKRKNVTGAISTIGAGDIVNRPVTNASSALAGLAAGVSVRQGSGDPRNDGATIRIRGTGTLNNSTPLFLVDGIQVSSIDNINPNDIESVSLLKDAASASIYGALGANGVVLVTTKKGARGKTAVTYTGMFSTAKPTGMLKLIDDSPRFMRLVNQSTVNLNLKPTYSDENIEAWEAASKSPNELNNNGIPNFVAYPNTNWFKETFQRSVVQNHNISVSGGGEKSTFLFSLGYLDNPGILPNTGVKRYQIRINAEAKPTKFLTLGTQTFASLLKADRGNTDSYFTYLWQSTPTVYPLYDGKYGGKVADAEPVTANNPLRLLFTDGGRDLATRINSTLYGNINLYKGLVFESRFNYQADFRESNGYPIPLPRWNIGANIQLDPDPAAALATQNVFYGLDKSYSYTIDEILRYNTQIAGKHELGAFIGYNEYYSNTYNFRSEKRGLLDYSIYTFDGATTPVIARGNESDWSLRSLFGRLNYAYRNRYLFEANFRRDGTSQFAEEKRWGTFTSFSAGWNIAEEAFFESVKDQVRNLKLRASWGTLGNNRMDVDNVRQNYLWQSTYTPVIYSFNTAQLNGVAQRIFANPGLLWESTEAANVGLDASLLKGSLDISLEGYRKRTYDILTRPNVPPIAGKKAPPFVNGPEVINKGVEVNVNWRKTFSDFKVVVGGNFNYNKNEVSRYKGAFVRGFTTDANGNTIYTSNMGATFSESESRTPIVEGRMFGDYFVQTVYRGTGTYFNTDGSVNKLGGPKDGMIRTKEDLEWVNAMKTLNYRFAPLNTVDKAQLYYGDLIYADNNGDSIYGNTHDRVFMNASAIPSVLVGFNVNVGWKNFDFSMIWAGAFGMKYYWNQSIYNNTVTVLGYGISERVADNSYYFNEANPAEASNRINGSLPRLKSGTDAINGVNSNFWLYDASYMRLKNVQLGYTLPTHIAQKASISNARIFIAGENLLMISRYPGLDPEIGANVGYPTMKQFTLGLNLTF